ncbi:glutaredoxin [Tumebacillus sp. BK434]|uniref:glutaredoxin family protein n=1 Tax=Tumebacillus sp. BK434 TaxID=2512169 RepID=UPI0010531799|nr:glutaredoxin family protein [Tumebacillus sp. BK434]TCP59157.1 glutaredoxin [Tumebacillus sp. BK434]
MADKKIIIYTQPTCPPCFEAKAWMTNSNIPFEDRDIRKDDKHLQDLINLGAAATPVFLVGDEVIMGYDQGKIKSAWDAL